MFAFEGEPGDFAMGEIRGGADRTPAVGGMAIQAIDTLGEGAVREPLTLCGGGECGSRGNGECEYPSDLPERPGCHPPPP